MTIFKFEYNFEDSYMLIIVEKPFLQLICRLKSSNVKGTNY